MHARTKVFVDSNVVVSALKSSFGAAYALIASNAIHALISNLSRLEILAAVKRLKLDEGMAKKVLDQKFEQVDIGSDLARIRKKFADYVSDADDSHVVAAAAVSKSGFLVTHNLKHFKREKIKQDLGVLTLSPSQFLQYLRSLR